MSVLKLICVIINSMCYNSMDSVAKTIQYRSCRTLTIMFFSIIIVYYRILFYYTLKFSVKMIKLKAMNSYELHVSTLLTIDSNEMGR